MAISNSKACGLQSTDQNILFISETECKEHVKGIDLNCETKI